MIFNLSQTSNQKLRELYDKAMEELSHFYEMDWNQNKPILFIVNSREDIDILKGKKTEEWVIGFTLGSERFLFLLNPEKYERESSHKYDEKSFYLSLKHELSHLYSNIFYKGFFPVWLVEGIAIYSSGQLEEKFKPKKLEYFLTFFQDGGKGLYDESGYAVEVMVKEIGKKKFLEFYKSLKAVKTEEDLKDLFLKYYGEELSYEYFNKRLWEEKE